MGTHRYRQHSHKGVTPVIAAGVTKWKSNAYHATTGIVNVGTFDTPERAQMATRLFKHWLTAGHNPPTIPRKPRTIDAI